MKSSMQPSTNISIGPEGEKRKSGMAYFSSFFKSEKSVKLFSYGMGLLILVLSVLAASQLKKLNTEYSIEQFFPAKHKLLQQTAKIRQTFQLQERPAYLIVLEQPPGSKNHWLEPKSLAKLQTLTKHLQERKEVRSAVSLATLEGALEEDKSLVVGPIYERLPLAKWVNFTKSNELLREQLISKDLKSVLLLVEPQRLAPKAMADFAINMQKSIENDFPGVKIEIGGLPAIQGRFSERLFHELRLFLVLSLLAFCFVFCLFFRSFSAFLLTLCSLLFVNVVVIGALAYFQIPFSVLLSTLPIVVSIALISVMIHSMHRWAEVVQKSWTPAERFSAAIRVLKEMALPNFLGSLTTAIGFVTLCVTDIPLIRQYGWVVASAVMGAWFFTHFLLLGFMFRTNPILRNWTKSKAYWTLPILKRALPLFVVIVAATLAFAYKGKDITFAGRLFDDLPRSESARKATEEIDARFGGVVGYDLILVAKEKDFWKEPQNFKKLDALVSQLRHLKSLGSAISFADFFGEKVPASRQATAEFLFLYSMSESNPLKNYVTEDGKSVRVALRFHDLNSKEIDLSRGKIKRLLGRNFPQVQIQEAGLAVSSHTINQEVAKGLVFGFWHSLVIIGLLLMLIFRSVRWALVACIPNLVPPAFLIGALAIAQTPVKPGVALVFSIALGLAFNNTVYLLTRLKRIMKEESMTVLPLRRTLLQEGNPCLFETMIMFFGFVIFLTSDFKLNQIFGAYMLLSIVAGAIGDLVFLPAMLKLFPSLIKTKSLPKKLLQAPVAVSIAPDSLMEDSLVASEENKTGRIAASVAMLLILGFSAPRVLQAAQGPQRAPAQAAPGTTAVAPENEALEILKKAQKQLESKDDQAVVNMKIIEANGEVKTRVMKLQTLHDKKFHALVRIEKPADIKGTGFLAEIGDGKEEQWIYLPSSKQVRRVVGTKKSTGVLGSELTVEDLNSAAIKGAKVQLLKKEADAYILQVTPKAGTSLYNKVLMSISVKDSVPLKTQYFQGNKLKKSVSFLKYKKIGSVWRAQLIQVKNLANKRGTDLELSEIKVNSGLSADDFSTNSLKAD